MTLNNTRIHELLVRMVHHYQKCLPLVEPHSHQNISRSAYRFVKIEKVMIKKMAELFLDHNGEDFMTQHTRNTITLLDDYSAMHGLNTRMLRELKQCLRSLDNTHLAAALSYWVAALQVENDELGKYIPQGE